MAISFSSIGFPLVPSTLVEFDSSNAQQGPSVMPYRALVIAQKLPSGSAEADTAVRCTSVEQAIALAGRGSMAHRKALGWFASNKSTEMWLGLLEDDEYGNEAEGTIVVSGPAEADGTISLYIGGERITVGVTDNDSASTIATAIRDAINAAADLPVTATALSATVTVEFRHTGEVGNGYDIRHSFRDGEALPAGVDLEITAMAGGTGNPPLDGLFAAIEPLWFHIIAHPYTDAESLEAIEGELALRNDPTRSMDGLAITSAIGSFGTLASLGNGRNSQHSCILAQPGPNPLTPPMEFAAEAAGLVAKYGAADPARPFQTLAFSRAIAPAETDQWSFEERNLLLLDGIATTKRVVGGGVQLERVVTTYQTSPGGAPDSSYRDATTLLTLMYLRYDWRARLQRKYPRHKLADDGTKYGAGQAIMTPKLGRAEAIAWFDEKVEQGLVENPEQFARDLICERNQTDRNRLDWRLPTDLINFLAVSATSIQFIL